MRPVVDVAAFLACGLLSGGLALAGGALLGPPSGPTDAAVVECAGFPIEVGRAGLAHIRVDNPRAAAARLEVRYLDGRGAVLYTERFELAGGDMLELETATSNMGPVVRVVATGALAISAGAEDVGTGAASAAVRCEPVVGDAVLTKR